VSPVAISQSDISVSRGIVSSRLKDPNSAQWRGERAYLAANGDRIVCGEVNAKNSFGGYPGFTHFYIRSSGGVVQVARVDSNTDTLVYLAKRGCDMAAQGSIPIG